MASLQNQLIRQTVLALSKDGGRLIKECAEEVDYTHRTKNLYDSYGYGVYYGGSLKRMGCLKPSASATETKDWYGEKVSGRDEIETFLKSVYKPKSRGFELVIAAAMPYGKVLENASSGQKRKYKVISMAYDKLVEYSKQLDGSYVTALTGGKI